MGFSSLMHILLGGANREALASLALIPYGGSGKRVWRWPDGSGFRYRMGVRLGRLLPGLGGELELPRIGGVGFGRTGGTGGAALNLPSDVIAAIPNVALNVNKRRAGKTIPVPGKNERRHRTQEADRYTCPSLLKSYTDRRQRRHLSERKTVACVRVRGIEATYSARRSLRQTSLL